jgi:dipeptidyl aminopeptidase/acylaminoacyl peptidase
VYGAITDLAAFEGERARYLREIAADSVLLRTSGWLDRVRRPVLICHDEDDPLVPRRQATLLRDVLRSNAVPHACLGFRAEGHGLGRADAVAEALEAELSFYGQVLGFEPPETARLDLVAGGQESRPGLGRPSPPACWGHR